MSLVIFTKDSNHIGGVYLGFHESEDTFFSGGSYLGCTVGVSSPLIHSNVHNFFEINGTLEGIHSGNTHGSQYVVFTNTDIFVEIGGKHPQQSMLLQDSSTVLFGNRLLSGTTIYQQIFDSITQSSGSVKDKIVNALKLNKINSLDRIVVGQSSYGLELVVVDYFGNVVNNQKYYSKVNDPIDLLT